MTRTERKRLIAIASRIGYDHDEEVARAELRMSHNSAKYAGQTRETSWRHDLATCRCSDCKDLRMPYQPPRKKRARK